MLSCGTSEAMGGLSKYEPILRNLIKHAVFEGGMLNDGSVIDCGCHLGFESCFYANLDPSRIVHAVDPSLALLKTVNKFAMSRPNIRPMHGALGSIERMVEMRHSEHTGSMLLNVHQQRNASNTSKTGFPMYRVDSLFEQQWAGEKLAFAHFDTEGSELDVLHGARGVIRRDQPLFTIEILLSKRKSLCNALLQEVKWLGYLAYMVPESCGVQRDCRNLICVPRGRHVPKLLLNNTTALTKC